LSSYRSPRRARFDAALSPARYWRIAGQSLNFWPSASAGFFIGQIARVEIYNRPLATAEIEQNFNINRGRFGL
jgi:hypothetical protein